MTIEVHRAALKAMEKFPLFVLTQAKEAFFFLSSARSFQCRYLGPCQRFGLAATNFESATSTAYIVFFMSL